MIRTQTKYKHLFFDLDHTLWDFKSNSERAMHLCLEQLNILPQLPSFADFFAFYEGVNDRLWDEYRQGISTKEELRSRRFAEPFAHFGIKHDAEQANSFYLDLMNEQTQLFPGCTELLSELKVLGYQLHIISNGFVEVQHKKMQSAGIAHFFQSITLSETVSAPKPKAAIFEYALRNVNARKSESIMMGDDWNNDVMGAIRFGIDAVLFQAKRPNYTEVLQIEDYNAYSTLHLDRSPKCQCFWVANLLDIIPLLAH